MDDDDDIPRPPSPAKRRRYDDTTIRSRPATSRTASSIVSDAPNLGPALPVLGRATRSSRSPTKSSPTRRTGDNTNSQASGRSSPQKALAALEVVDDGLVRRDFNLIEPDLPGPLVDLLTVVMPLASGTGVISPSAKVSSAPLSGNTLYALDQHVFTIQDAITSHPQRVFSIGIDASKYSVHRDTYGPTPSTDQVLNILEAAANCERNSHHESSWNIEVHHRVLETALRFRSSNQPSNLFAQPVNFMVSTTAGIAIGKPPLAPFQKIDFCLYIDPATVGGTERKDYITKTIDAVRSTIPDQHLAINHTDHFPLRRNPITVSIETKRSSDNWDKANLQIAVWQAAQWNFLRWMAQGDTEGDRVGDTRDDTRYHTRDIGLEFLPGIVIMGHHWYLTATTNDGKRTVSRSALLGLLLATQVLLLGVSTILCYAPPSPALILPPLLVLLALL